MYDWLYRLLTMGSGLFAAWFTFYYVSQPPAPLYHQLLLFLTSWILCYSFISMLFLEQSPSKQAENNTKKVRRKKPVSAIDKA